MIKYLNFILENKKIFFLLVLVCLTSRAYYEIEYSDFYVDKAYQIAVSKNIDQGYGPKLVSLSDVDIDETKIRNLEGYTVFYSYLISIFTPNISYKNSADLIDVVSVLIIVFSTLILFKNINVSRKTQSMFLLFFAFVPFPFNILTSNDLFLTAYFVALVSWFYLNFNSNTLKIQPLIFISILIGVLPFIKISSIPYMLTFPSFYILNFLFTKNISYLKRGLIMFIISVLTLFIIFYFIPFYGKSKTSEFGFYPVQLLQFDPFIQKSLLFINDYIRNISFYNVLKPGLVILNFISLIVFYKMFKSKKSRFNSFYLFTFSSILITILFYSFCSIIFKGEVWKIPHWTYVETSRYFGGAIIVFQIAIFFVFEERVLNNLVKSIFLVIFIFNGLMFSKGFYDNALLNKNKYNFNDNYGDMIMRSKFINSVKTEKKKLYINLNKKSGFDENFIYVNSDIFHHLECGDLDDFNISKTEDFCLFINFHKDDKDRLISKLKANNFTIKAMKEINDQTIILTNLTR